MDPWALYPYVAKLVSAINAPNADCVLGFVEGWVVPAFAYAQATTCRLVISTRFHMSLPDPVSFDEPHSGIGRTHYLYGLEARHRVVIVEDEVTTGRTIVNAVRALRSRGIDVVGVGAVLVVDSPALWARMGAEGIVLHAAALLPADLANVPD